ncbi:alpha/beta fold hydrolase [Acidobacteria bacterium AH-259-G07]|nr:alpha/beta fold hydrolase [Acidobacteria bacterium AH-259-G07]
MREYDVSFESTHIHFLEEGSGFPVLLLHGSGPGVSTMGNFRKVLDGLANRYHVVAMDWIGFGSSGQLSSPPYFDMALWERQIQFALDRVTGEKVGILAHSLASVFALKAAASNTRVSKILMTGAMGTPFQANEHLTRIWTFPATQEELRKALECLVYDQSVITDDFIQNRFENLHRGNYEEYFSSMFSGDKQPYVDASILSAELLQEIQCKVLILHGRDDLPIPFEETALVLAKNIPRADLWIIAQCGHSPALEHPNKLLAAAKSLFG